MHEQMVPDTIFLQKVLPDLEQDVLVGMMITVEDQRIRRRPLPVF